MVKGAGGGCSGSKEMTTLVPVMDMFLQNANSVLLQETT